MGLKEYLNEGNVEKLVKEYYKMHKAIKKEKQFNKQVDMNGKIRSFMMKNKMTIKRGDLGITIFIDGKEVAIIQKQWAKRKTNLNHKELKQGKLVFSKK